jgi:hypothetical protein
MVVVDGALADKAARAGDASFCLNLLRINTMKTSKTLAALLICASVATVALAKGPGSGAGMGGGASAGASAGTGPGVGVGTQTRDQVRDPASNLTGVPLKTRDRIHTPVVAPAVTTVPAVVPAN